MSLPLPTLDDTTLAQVNKIADKEGRRLAAAMAEYAHRDGPEMPGHLARNFSSFLIEGGAQNDLDRHAVALERAVNHGLALLKSHSSIPTAREVEAEARSNMREMRTYTHLLHDPMAPLPAPRSEQEVRERRELAKAAAREPTTRYAESLKKYLRIDEPGKLHHLADRFSSFLEEGHNRGQLDSYLSALNSSVDIGVAKLESHAPASMHPSELVDEARHNLRGMGLTIEPQGVANWMQARKQRAPIPSAGPSSSPGMKA